MKYYLTLLFVLTSLIGFSQSISQYHRTDISNLTSSANLNQPLSTFDYPNPIGVPNGWYNAYVSTHRDYLHSFIIHKHRTNDWYLGWMEENRTDPVWLKIYHTGNDDNLAKLHVENIFQKNLKVNASIYTKEINVSTTSWADFVFEETYDLRSLKELKDFIKLNGHLPNIPSEDDVISKGVNVAEMNKLLLQKVEELTLYTIQQQSSLEKKQTEIDELKNETQTLRDRLDQIEMLLNNQ